MFVYKNERNLLTILILKQEIEPESDSIDRIFKVTSKYYNKHLYRFSMISRFNDSPTFTCYFPLSVKSLSSCQNKFWEKCTIVVFEQNKCVIQTPGRTNTLSFLWSE